MRAAPAEWPELGRRVAEQDGHGPLAGGAERARAALELIVGDDGIAAGVRMYVDGEECAELIRSVFILLRSSRAIAECARVAAESTDDEIAEAAIELARAIPSAALAPYAVEWLDDARDNIAVLGSWACHTLFEHDLWGDFVDTDELLRKMAEHRVAEVRSTAERIRGL